MFWVLHPPVPKSLWGEEIKDPGNEAARVLAADGVNDGIHICGSCRLSRFTRLALTHRSKKEWITQPIVCTRQNLKPCYFDRRHLGETTLHASALDLRSHRKLVSPGWSP